MKRFLAMCLSAILLAGLLPAQSMAQNGEGYVASRFSAAEKTFSITNTEEKQQALSTGWQYADGTDATSGIDLSAHDPANLRLEVSITLSMAGTSAADETLFAAGQVQLRSPDTPQEHNSRWLLNGQGLKSGENHLSFSFEDLKENKGQLDLSNVNRFLLYIDSLNKAVGTFTMTLTDVRIVDTTGFKPAGTAAAAVAEPSPGMPGDEPILYNRNAVDKGADPSGQADSTDAIQSSLNEVAKTGGVVFLPAGRYRVEGILSVPEGVTLRGEWRNPDEGGLGQGTILMAYAGRGETDPEAKAFIQLKKGTSLQSVGVWYPEQDAADIQPYPAAIRGEGHNYIHNITLYNAYIGFYDHHCSSLLVRGLYGTVLSTGIDAAEGYDIPRIEEVSFDTAYWIDSGLPGAPAGLAADRLNSYARERVTGILTGRQDGGYWYDLTIANARYGCYIENGGIYIGALTTRKVQYGVYVTGISYPGLELTYSDIEASINGLYYAVPERETAVISKTSFRGADTAVYGVGTGRYGINLNDCTLSGWRDQAIRMNGGNLTVSGSAFEGSGGAILLQKPVSQAVLTGNRFADADRAVSAEVSTRLVRNDSSRDVPSMPDYDHPAVPVCRAGSDQIYLAGDYGAVTGGVQDCTGAIQAALDDAGKTGGIVYLPGGIYRLNGSLLIPKGVELRGSFEGPHFGNSTMKGTQLYVYAGKGQADDTPLLDMGEGAGVSGMTVFYPEQGFSDKLTDSRGIKAYPAAIRANRGSFIRNMALVNAYTGIDAMTNRCDSLVISDVSGMALYQGMSLGHGTRGGAVRNFHLNSSGWVQQSGYANAPTGASVSADQTEQQAFEDYLTRTVTEFTLGDAQDVHFFSCFGIDIATDIRLIQDPYTGGSFKGTTWGVVFDGSYNGIVAEDGCDAQLTMLGTMGIFNKQGGGYNVVTRPGFTGHIRLMTAGELGGGSKLALVEGGHVEMVQVFSSSAFNGVCRAGGRLDFVGSTIITQYGDDDGNTPDITYEKGASGLASANLDCMERLNIRLLPGSAAIKRLNGREHPDAADWRCRGDINGDGEVTAEDALLALQYATRKIGLDEDAILAGDADGDGHVTAGDALLILQGATGKIVL